MLLTLLAALPILVVLALMVGRGWGGAQAGAAGWVTALLVATGIYGAGPVLVFYSQAKALFNSLFVLYIIWFALALSQVVTEADALDVVSGAVARLTADRTMQLLILGWVFASFIQGVTGFGVPAAVVAPLLISLGFPPVMSVVATSLGHAWAVTFGSLGSSMAAMVAVTGLPAAMSAPPSAAMLGTTCVLCGCVVAYTHRGWSTLRHGLLAVAIVGIVMATVQYFAASSRLWNLAAFVASIAGLLVAAAVARLPLYRGTPDERAQNGVQRAVRDAAHMEGTTGCSRLGLPLALSGYLALLVVVMAAELVPAVPAVLNRVNLTVAFPATQTSLGWLNKAEAPRSLSIFGHPGALIAYAAVLAYLIYRSQGCYRAGVLKRIAQGTVQAALKPTIGILFLVGMAMLMQDSGMTYRLAEALSAAVGRAFPLVAPFVGALGAFMTGTNTQSNVIFAGLQWQTAQALAMNGLIILAAQNVGGAVGSVFAPTKVIVACGAAGIAHREGEVLRQNLVYGLVIVAVTGVLALLLMALGR